MELVDSRLLFLLRVGAGYCYRAGERFHYARYDRFVKSEDNEFIAAINDIVNEADSLFHFSACRDLPEVVNLYHGRGPCSASEFRVRGRFIFHQIADKIILCKFVFLPVINIHCEILAGFLREVFQSKTFIPAEIARLP